MDAIPPPESGVAPRRRTTRILSLAGLVTFAILGMLFDEAVWFVFSVVSAVVVVWTFLSGEEPAAPPEEDDGM